MRFGGKRSYRLVNSGPGQDDSTPKWPHLELPQNLWLPKQPQPFWAKWPVSHTLRSLPKRPHYFGQNGHSGITIKSVNIKLFWLKSSYIRITTKTATHFSLQWRTARITTIRGASLGISMGVFMCVWLYLKILWFRLSIYSVIIIIMIDY